MTYRAMYGSKVLFLIKKPAGIEELFQRKAAFLMPLPEFGHGWVLLLDVAGHIWNSFRVKLFLGFLASGAFGVAKKDHGGSPPAVGYLSCFAVGSIIRHCCMENNGGSQRCYIHLYFCRTKTVSQTRLAISSRSRAG